MLLSMSKSENLLFLRFSVVLNCTWEEDLVNKRLEVNLILKKIVQTFNYLMIVEESENWDLFEKTRNKISILG